MAAGGTRPTRLYTRTGDHGTTALAGATRVGKDSLRLEAYGALDELASWIGWVTSQLPASLEELHPLLRRVEHELFLAENELAAPEGRDPRGGRIEARHVRRLEEAIDRYSAPADRVRSFVLPGGSAPSAGFHVARTVARRAERDFWRLNAVEPQSPKLGEWLNRLSDLFFALALWANDVLGVPEVPPDYAV